MKKALHGWKLDGKGVALAVAPTIPHHCSREFLLACLKLAKDYDTGLHSHVSESKVQVVAGYQLYGSTLTAYMDSLGLVGPNFTVAHGVWLDGDDMKLLGDKGASVSHNPGSNMRLGNGLADMRAMLDAKVNVGIGTDGATLLGQPEHVREHAAGLDGLQGAGAGLAALDHDRGGAGGGDRRQRPGARAGRQDRQAREGLQGRHRLPRSRAT